MSYNNDDKIKINAEKYTEIIWKLKNSVLIYDKVIYVLLVAGLR